MYNIVRWCRCVFPLLAPSQGISLLAAIKKWKEKISQLNIKRKQAKFCQQANVFGISIGSNLLSVAKLWISNDRNDVLNTFSCLSSPYGH
jgi:hypothetical protein